LAPWWAGNRTKDMAHGKIQTKGMSEFVPPLTIRPWVFAAKAYGYIPHVMPQLLKGILKALETFDRLLRRTIIDLLVSSPKMC